MKELIKTSVRYIDLFCGIGGFHSVGHSLGWECVFASDIDKSACKAYEENWGLQPVGDITQISPHDIPHHDVLFAGFPCQPFSIAGNRLGFDDTRGTLFFQVAAILEAHNTSAFVLENVSQLVSHNKGKTLIRILEILDNLGYKVEWRILNALDFGLPHNRRRIFIVGYNPKSSFMQGDWPLGNLPMTPLSELLEVHDKVDKKHFVSDRILKKRKARHTTNISPSIWHENKSGNIASHPFSCALRANPSYNYLLVDGIRRLTPREMLRLQGFSDDFKIVCNDSQTRKQAGNSVAIPVVKAVVDILNLVNPAMLVSNINNIHI